MNIESPTKAIEGKVSHRDMANAIRFLAIDAVEKAKSGHPGMPMGMADVATVLFSHFLKFEAFVRYIALRKTQPHPPTQS